MIHQAIIAKRTDNGTPDLAEIRGLTEAAGGDVVGEVRQARPADPGTHFGAGKVEELADLVAETGAGTVVVDDALTPGQTVNLEEAAGARVLDRHRVVLEIFAERARTREAQLQVELARLKYELPRVRERADEGALNRWAEKGTRYYDLLDRIDEIERQLQELPRLGTRRREERREQGFDLVAIAGYTNAGKTTLLRQLADEMNLEESSHADLDETAAVEDRLFKTLETTTRRATIAGRRVLLTDTVGFLEDLPHWLVESFRGTLGEVTDADAVVLVLDAAQPTDELRRKLRTSLDTLGADRPPLVIALNKVDAVEAREIGARIEAVESVDVSTVPISATEGNGLDALREAIAGALPALAHAELELPLTDESMSLLSWVHAEAVEVDVTYRSDTVRVAFEAPAQTVAQAKARGQTVGARPP